MMILIRFRKWGLVR